MKHPYLLLIALAFCLTLQAQKVTAGLHFLSAFPSSNYQIQSPNPAFTATSNNAPPGTGIGGFFSISYQTKTGFAFGFEAGYIQYAEETYNKDISLFFFTISNQGVQSATAMPAMFTAEYFFLKKNFRPYAGIGAGMLFYQPYLKADGLGYENITVLLQDQNGFLLSPRAGVRYNVTKNIAVDFQVQYNYALNNRNNADAISKAEDTTVKYLGGIKMSDTKNLSVNMGFVFTLLEK